MIAETWLKLLGGLERNRVLRTMLVGAAFLAIVLLLFARAMARELNHDEHQFVAPGVLLLRDGLLPYRAYPFFHMPNLVFAFAALFATTPHLLLAARSFNTLCAALLLLLVLAIAASRLRGMQQRRWIVGLSFVLLLSLNPFFRFTAGRAWNHDLAVLASVAAFAALLRAARSSRAWLWTGASGVLLGVAIGTRLSFAPLLAPFTLFVLLCFPRGLPRICCLASLAVGAGIALLPAALLFCDAPSQFLFGTFTYHRTLNPLYNRSPVSGELALFRKLASPAKELLKSPCDLALAVGFVYFGLRPWWRAGWRNTAERREIAALAFILPFLLLGCLASTPFHPQYYYPLVPFLLLGNIYGIALEGRWRARTSWLIAGTLFAGVLETIPDLPYAKTILRPAQWAVVTVHAKAEQVRRLLADGRVLTLAPIFPLEVNLPVYPELASGPFAWRTAKFLDKRTQATYHVLDPADLEQFLRSDPPAGILTGFEPHEIELPLETYAKAHGYLAHPLEECGTLWLPRR